MKYWFVILLIFSLSKAQAQEQQQVDGNTYDRYKKSHFNPKRGIFYSIFLAPVVTIDPLGIGGKSTYGLALGTQVRLWESKTKVGSLSGLSIVGLYTAAAYEYYPQQYDKMYAALWMRIHAMIPLALKGDLIYAKGYGKQGISYRLGVGTEVGPVSIFVCGEYYLYYFLGPHPNFESPYTNAGEIMVIIPIFTRKEK